MADPPPPPLPPKELPINRYKFIWRVLLISNLALGGRISPLPTLIMRGYCHLDKPTSHSSLP
ncbi:hypothetical protein PRUPE_7G210200 [Prunus persica]|uniref:Uncharacterized protein n=1 Tax=Prunus persica TaxID=3760 RepID=A0A251NES2_PRUPE|nr:hypothetical protein PRUPE_7G210200 [Prunus persica]